MAVGSVGGSGGGGGEETLTQTQKEILVELRKSLGTLRVMFVSPFSFALFFCLVWWGAGWLMMVEMRFW